MVRNSIGVLGSATLAGALLTAGCTPSPEAIKLFNEKVSPLIGVKLSPDGKPQPTSSPQATEEHSLSHRQINAEFLKEMFKVVLLRDVRSEEEFLKYMNVLDQGAHYEGLYNGIVYSSEYRAKEVGVAPVSALKMYAELMAQIMLDQKYDPLKIQKPEAPDVPPPPTDDIKPPQPSETERAGLVSQYEKDGLTKSSFTLKRRLGEEVLRTIDLKKEYKEKFATWYGRFVTLLNKKGVDFGLAQRNRADEYYHYKWALEADEDRLKWECLNRIHVLLNGQAK